MKNRVEYICANVSSLSQEYKMGKAAFGRAVLHNALKVFRLIL